MASNQRPHDERQTVLPVSVKGVLQILHRSNLYKNQQPKNKNRYLNTYLHE